MKMTLIRNRREELFLRMCDTATQQAVIGRNPLKLVFYSRLSMKYTLFVLRVPPLTSAGEASEKDLCSTIPGYNSKTT